MILIWLGALLVIAGVLFMAGQAIWRGPLSRARRPRPAVTVDTLEPPASEGEGAFGLAANWPGLALMALGGILLLVGGAI